MQGSGEGESGEMTDKAGVSQLTFIDRDQSAPISSGAPLVTARNGIHRSAPQSAGKNPVLSLNLAVKALKNNNKK